MNTGKNANRHVGVTCQATIRTTSTGRQIRKSTRLTTSELSGTISRGKYTFETRLALLTRLLLDSLRAVLKSCQGSIPASTSRVYGTSPDGSRAILLKTNTKTST